MCSSCPARTPKLKLAVEQLLTKGCWNPPLPKNKKKKKKREIDKPCSRTKEKPQDSRRSATANKSNHTPARWETHKLENSNNFSHCCDGSGP